MTSLNLQMYHYSRYYGTTYKCQISECKKLCSKCTTICDNHLDIENIKTLLKDVELPEIGVLSYKCQHIHRKGPFKDQLCHKMCLSQQLFCKTHKHGRESAKVINNLDTINMLIRNHNLEITKGRQKVAKNELDSKLISDIINMVIEYL